MFQILLYISKGKDVGESFLEQDAKRQAGKKSNKRMVSLERIGRIMRFIIIFSLVCEDKENQGARQVFPSRFSRLYLSNALSL